MMLNVLFRTAPIKPTKSLCGDHFTTNGFHTKSNKKQLTLISITHLTWGVPWRMLQNVHTANTWQWTTTTQLTVLDALCILEHRVGGCTRCISTSHYRQHGPVHLGPGERNFLIRKIRKSTKNTHRSQQRGRRRSCTQVSGEWGCRRRLSWASRSSSWWGGTRLVLRRSQVWKEDFELKKDKQVLYPMWSTTNWTWSEKGARS